MRDHQKLRAFQLADALVLAVYVVTKSFPMDEMFGLTAQLRRAAVSITSNIVEGCARRSEIDFLHFLDMAYGSAEEALYQISLAYRLGYIRQEAYAPLHTKSEEVAKVLNGLICSLRKKDAGV